MRQRRLAHKAARVRSITNVAVARHGFSPPSATTKCTWSPSPSSSKQTVSPCLVVSHSPLRNTRAIFREGTLSKQCSVKAKSLQFPFIELDLTGVDRQPHDLHRVNAELQHVPEDKIQTGGLCKK